MEFKIQDHLTDEQAMQLAICEAKKGAGFVSPNPQVGCVILDSHNRLLSFGYHAKFGGPHAEINAMKGLSHDQLEKSRLFVTLEPCAHEGKTPSCAKVIAGLPVKISEVIYGLIDPNPKVQGKGIEILNQAGIKTTKWESDQTELNEVCEHFLCNFEKKLPFVSLKVASSLDGQMALANGESKWITNQLSREEGHYLRATHEALLVGVNTILKDNPELNVRHPRFPNKKNKLVVIDPNGRLLAHPDLKIFSVHEPDDLFIVVTDKNLRTEKANLIYLGQFVSKDKIDSLGEGLASEINLNELLKELFKLGIHSVLVEGGALTLSSFISQMAANRLYLFQASMLLGANYGLSWSKQVRITNMKDRVPLRNTRLRSLDSDILITGLF